MIFYNGFNLVLDIVLIIVTASVTWMIANFPEQPKPAKSEPLPQWALDMGKSSEV